MPLPIALAHRILNRLTAARQQGEVDWIRPDSKSQVTVEFDGPKPVRIDTIVVSTQHAPDVAQETLRRFVIDKVIRPCLPDDLVNGEIVYHVQHAEPAPVRQLVAHEIDRPAFVHSSR